MERRPYSDAVVKEAEKVFRACAIDHLLSRPENASVTQTLRLDNCVEPGRLPDNFLDSLITPLPPSTRLVVKNGKNGYELEEVPVDDDEAGQASTSMSLSRTPARDCSGIKGSSSNIPFIPGGFEEELENVIRFAKEATDAEHEDIRYMKYDELLTTVPGLEGRADLSRFVYPSVSYKDSGSAASPSKEEEHTSTGSNTQAVALEDADFFDLLDFVSAERPAFLAPPVPEKKEEESASGAPKAKEEGSEEDGTAISEVLQLATLRKSAIEVSQSFERTHGGEYNYAYVIPSLADLPEYAELMLRMAKKYPFPLDPFQQAAVVSMEKGESVFVAAHTSAGKTVVAEYAIALCKAHRTRAIYTSPIKALSNQKYRDLKMIFEDVGLVTGDIQIHPEAFCLIMTTEILRSMLYNGSEVIRELEWVVFDEVHYINDADRGHVWEEVLIMLPAHVGIIMLSATVPNCEEFADWVGRIKNRRLAVVSTHKRPVPLEHFLYTGQDGKTKKDIFCVVDQSGEFNYANYKKAVAAKAGVPAQPTVAARGGGAQGAGQGGGRGGDRGGGGGRGGDRGRGAQRGQARGGGGGGRGGQRGGGGANRGGGGFNRNDRNVYVNLIDYLKGVDKLPMVCFVFSRKRCDQNAALLRSIDLTTAVEKSHVTTFFAQCTSRLKGTDKELPQVLRMKELCLRGFAVHHSGILPILKEVVELLFQKGYVKILFATETFAMGVNMPARTVVFDSLTKHDGVSSRFLHPGEYIQMAGRAGRRGLDSTGTVIVLCKSEVPESGELQVVMKGKAAKLESKFRVTYSMLLNLLRAEQLRIEDMLQRSFVERAALRQGKERKSKLEEARSLLDSLPGIACPVCSTDDALCKYHSALVSFLSKRAALWPKWASMLVVDKLLSPGRFLIVTSAAQGLRNSLVVLLKEEMKTGAPTLQVLVPCSEQEAFVERPKPAGDTEWAEECARIDGSLEYGIEGLAPPGRVGAAAERRLYRIVSDLPLAALVGIVQRAVKVDAADIISDAKMREQPRFKSNPLSEKIAQLITTMDEYAEEYSGAKEAPLNAPGVGSLMVHELTLYEETNIFLSLRDAVLAEALTARHCPLLREHMAEYRRAEQVRKQISKLEHELSAASLMLGQEYKDKLKVLQCLGYVDADAMVTFKGRVACEIHHQELVLTELMLENKLHSRSVPEIAALLSALTCQYRASESGAKTEKTELALEMQELRKDVENVMFRIHETARKEGIQVNDGYEEIRFDLMEVVFQWASGMAFAEIMTLTQAQEGLIVRCIQRLGEVAKDVRNAARIVGDPELLEKMEAVQAAIKRDIVFAASLYTSV